MTGKCPFCGEEYEVEDSCYGRMAECPSCHRKFIIGQASAEAKPEGDSSMRRDANKSTNLVIDEFITPKVARIVFWIGSGIAICGMLFCITSGLNFLLSILGCALMIVGLRVSYELIVVVFAIEKNTRCGKEQCKALDDLKDAMMKLSERLA